MCMALEICLWFIPLSMATAGLTYMLCAVVDRATEQLIRVLRRREETVIATINEQQLGFKDQLCT